ncbi:peptidase M76 family-domain-containing protein [Auriculariales sp. MPI-PUGE-AT-0066]|nr:peptidase M76 family-domain-containing protein [Auriculariales sp. MPI-PUGE-AT-0066]
MDASQTTASPSFMRAFERWRLVMATVTANSSAPAAQPSQSPVPATAATSSSAPAPTPSHEELAAQWNRCERWKRDLMHSSPIVVFLRKHLAVVGCPVANSNLVCTPCEAVRAGGFDNDTGTVLLCQNRFVGKKHMEDTIAHELLHMYDHCRFKVDWHNLRHVACSEIRAANLSGDCRFSREFFDRFQFKVTKQHQTCVRRRALLAVSGHPDCPDAATAERAVNEVWDSCFPDTRPFDEIY